MDHHIPDRAARLAGTLTLVASVVACGGGGEETVAMRDATASDTERSTAAGAGSALAQSYAASAKAFTVDNANPILQWTYRAWCEAGIGAANGQAQPIKAVPAGGVRLMDNAWYFGSDNNTLVVRTPAGDLLVFDPLATAAEMKSQVIDQMSIAGLDPTRITHVFVGNEDATGYEGVNLILQTYAPAAKVVATKPAADAFTANVGRGKSSSTPKRIDITVAAATDQDQGSKLVTVESGVSVAAMLTPGATLGQMSVLVPVQHQGTTQRLLVWSGNKAALGQTDLYGSSTNFVEGFVVALGATAWFNTQAYQGPQLADYIQLKTDPNYSSYAVMGTEGVRRWLGIFANCNRALAQRTSSAI